MNFFLNTPITKSAVNISHQEQVLLLGSCFTENIGDKLTNHKFKVTTNPFGIIYNPISLANSLEKISSNYQYTEQDITENNGKHLSFDHHGSFSVFNKQECLTHINEQINHAQQRLNQTKTIIITLGTAWVYELAGTNRIVANCHKLPAKTFSKRLLTVDEVVNSFSKLISTLNDVNVVFTVSPVRHISDGLYENNISKSVLHLAIHQLMQQHKNCTYFAAYEMVIDELRDYRFFKEDMIHPSNQAIDYVWEKFADTYFSTETQTLNLKIEKLLSAVQHKPFDFKCAAHQNFITYQLNQMDELTKNYSFLNFEKEKSKIQEKPNI